MISFRNCSHARHGKNIRLQMAKSTGITPPPKYPPGKCQSNTRIFWTTFKKRRKRIKNAKSLFSSPHLNAGEFLSSSGGASAAHTPTTTIIEVPIFQTAEEAQQAFIVMLEEMVWVPGSLFTVSISESESRVVMGTHDARHNRSTGVSLCSLCPRT